VCERGGTLGLMEEMRELEEMEKWVKGALEGDAREMEGYSYCQYRIGRACTF
jgi:hypothetical protein